MSLNRKEQLFDHGIHGDGTSLKCCHMIIYYSEIHLATLNNLKKSQTSNCVSLGRRRGKESIHKKKSLKKRINIFYKNTNRHDLTNKY